jgi:hypothetical protein
MHTHSQGHPAPNRPSSPRWWGGPVLRSLALGAALGLALALPLSVQAKTFGCSAGDVPCLINAINAANANGEANTIRLAAGSYTLTAPDNFFAGSNGLPVITSPLTITGRGAERTSIERAASAPGFRLLRVAADGTLTLQRLTLRGGRGGSGGGISNVGTLTLVRTTVTDNNAPTGAGISNVGTLTLLHSAVTSNGPDCSIGGGLATSGTVTIAYSTIADNFCVVFGGGLAISGGTVTLHASTVTHNFAQGVGGGIENGRFGSEAPGGTVIITASAITNNASGFGAGIANNGLMVITNTTIAANTVIQRGRGSGIANFAGTLRLTNSTLAENNSLEGPPSDGEALSNASGTVLLVNTILARNTVQDCVGTITSLDNNLIGDPTGCPITLQPRDLTGDPGLGPFTDNGPPGTGHFPLLPTSQALDAGNDAFCPRTDQLGRRRISPCDIGATEFRERDEPLPDDEEEDEPDAEDAEDEEDVGSVP